MVPTLHAWTLTTAYDGGSTQVVAERNPYYWKVDSEGNQLPYLDHAAYDIVADSEVLVLKALNGEIDLLQHFHATPSNRPLFIDNMERGDYRFYEFAPNSTSTLIIMLNLTHKDPVKRQIFNNRDFRIGLSSAINRQEIIDLIYIYVGQSELWRVAPRRGLFYNEQLAKQYTEYDPDRANEHLDLAGYQGREAQGFRLGPDGQRISFAIDVTSFRPEYVNELELIQGYWREVGIDMQIRNLEDLLFHTRNQANEHDAVVRVGSGGFGEEVLDPRWYFPFSSESLFAIPWAQWYYQDPRGEEPPNEVRRQLALFDQLKATGALEQQAKLMNDIHEIAKEQFYAIGTVLEAPGYAVVANHLRNVSEPLVDGWQYPAFAPTHPEQYFVEPGTQQ